MLHHCSYSPRVPSVRQTTRPTSFTSERETLSYSRLNLRTDCQGHSSLYFSPLMLTHFLRLVTSQLYRFKPSGSRPSSCPFCPYSQKVHPLYFTNHCRCSCLPRDKKRTPHKNTSVGVKARCHFGCFPDS